MAGELWRGRVQIAKESSYGDGTQPATRRMYYTDPKFTLVREPRPKMFATSTRDNVRAQTVGPQVNAGELVQMLSADEIVELLLMSIAGGVTPTNPDTGVYNWVFTPSSGDPPLDSAAIEYHDGANPWLVSGCLVDRLQIKGSANGPADVNATVFARERTETTMTEDLAERTPTVIEGWETKFYIDAFGGTPGSTEVDGTLINWDITINNNLARKYFAADTNTLAAVATGVIGVEATLTFEAASGQSLTEFDNWNVALAQPTYRLVRLLFGNNQNITGLFNKYVAVDIPGAWATIALDQADEGTRAYQMKLSYVFDPDNEFGVQITAQNDRPAAWS